ncbi:response regulator [Mangrovicoccus algicola]|uniref:Response regulator transcription factor n=1 Tax=Mangrovicoccus algicola TaxID=2771008 RepID=A0A8J6YT54_9RHOB|nr:response regulator transcription factor [Mangrovicoccus algicola]MBE3636982.1 response regulator transcription factor [Mangrovicoccus algicola]
MKHDRLISGDGAVRSVLVIDDHPLYAYALTTALQHVFEDCRVRTAVTLKEGLAAIAAGAGPDLVMLDLRLPDVSGLSGLIRLRERLPETPVLIISAQTSVEVVQSLMDLGAAGFVPKDLPLPAIEQALAEIRRGNRYLPVEFRDAMRRRPAVPSELENISRRIAELSPQQMRIMKLICAGKANKQIAYELSLAEATVKAHVTALLRRLGVQNRTQAAVMMESVSLQDETGETPRQRG